MNHAGKLKIIKATVNKLIFLGESSPLTKYPSLALKILSRFLNLYVSLSSYLLSVTCLFAYEFCPVAFIYTSPYPLTSQCILSISRKLWPFLRLFCAFLMYISVPYIYVFCLLSLCILSLSPCFRSVSHVIYPFLRVFCPFLKYPVFSSFIFAFLRVPCLFSLYPVTLFSLYLHLSPLSPMFAVSIPF